MESGSGQPPSFGPGSPGYGPGAERPEEEANEPDSPVPAPDTPAGPQSPAPGAYPPPPPPPGPETLGAPQAPPQAPGYGGPVPPGGWQQSPAPPAFQPQGQLASWGSRLGAYAIDALVLFVPAVILFVVIVGGAVGISGSNDNVATGALVVSLIGWGLLFLAMSLLYAPLLMMRKGKNNGQTWGKQIVGLRAVRDDGRPYDFGSAALREVVLKGLAVGVASSIIPFIPWFLNFFWPLWDDQNRALHDMAASSHVVRA